MQLYSERNHNFPSLILNYDNGGNNDIILDISYITLIGLRAHGKFSNG